MNNVMPSTFATCGCSRRMMSDADPLRCFRGFRLIWIRPLLMVALVPSMPMNDERLSTAGSFRITLANSCWCCAMRRERNILRAFGNAQDDAGILHREKALRHVDVQKDRANERGHGDQQRGRAVSQHELQRAAVKVDDRLEAALRGPVEPALLAFVLMLQ